MGIEVLYSSVEFILDFCRANKIGWQTDSADFAMTVYNLSPSFSPINGTVVKDEPNNVVVNVEYSRDTQKAIEKMIADAIASLA